MPIFAIEDALTGGGIVGGIVTAAGALYVLWEKWSRRKTEASREELALEEARIKLGVMARTELGVAFEEERQARKSAHDADIRAIRREIEEYQTRLAAIESREKDCQAVCIGLKRQNTEQAAEIAELRAKIAELEKKLKDNGALPGTGPHAPLGGW